jgi:predicted GNAT family acetyltransferase
MNFKIGDSILELTVLEDSVEISNLFVPFSDRKKGVANELFKLLISHADKNNLTLSCNIFPYGEVNYKAVIELCKKHGFECVGDKLSVEQPFQEMRRSKYGINM